MGKKKLELNAIEVVFNLWPQAVAPFNERSTGFYFEGNRAGAKAAFSDFAALADKGNVPIVSVRWIRDFVIYGEDIDPELSETIAQWPAPAGGGSAA